MQEEQNHEAIENDESANGEGSRPRKLDKVVDQESMELKIKVIGVDTEYSVHKFDDLPDHIKKACAMHGLSQKLGDAAGGKDPEDAREAIDQQWQQILSGDFVTRVQGDGVNKRSKENIRNRLEHLDPAKRAEALKVFEDMGITL